MILFVMCVAYLKNNILVNQLYFQITQEGTEKFSLSRNSFLNEKIQR